MKQNMTAKQFIKRIAYWQKKMGLINWNFYLNWKTKQKIKIQGKDFIAGGFTTCNVPYKDAVLSFNKESLTENNKALDELIIHELTHVVMSPLVGFRMTQKEAKHPMFNIFNEQVTSELARIILRMHKGETLEDKNV